MPLSLLIAGCGSALLSAPRSANEIFSISGSSQTITTNGQVRLRAVLASGAAAAVNWSVTEGQNDGTIGEGRIDATGLYTPPAAVSRDAVQVVVTAQLQSDRSRVATAVLTVTPGFLQPLTPETATLAAGATLQITGQIAEVNGGSILWSLSGGGTEAGSLSGQSCQRSAQNYTTCTVLYTAPATLTAGSGAVSNGTVAVVGTIATPNGAGGAGAAAPVSIRLNAEGITSTPLVNQAVQTGPVVLGASGGNNTDYDADADGNVLECCGGTLGALVASANGSQYILSNNHVLAESDQAATGDTILEPGLIDSGCAPHPRRDAGRPVGALKYYVPLASTHSNVDAALALVNPGAVATDGAILQLGPARGANAGATLSSAPPAGGGGEAIGASSFGDSSPIEVAKSGRTTGLTCSTIDAIDLDVEVDYFKDCAETQPYYTKTFTGQIGIPGNGFADSGDSGALIVDSRNAEPVGLLFATGSDGRGAGYSVANPIRDVLGELGSQAGEQFNVVGGGEHPVACLKYDQNRIAVDGQSFSAAERARSAAAVQIAGASLVHRVAGVLGVAVGNSNDDVREPAVIVYVERGWLERLDGSKRSGTQREGAERKAAASSSLAAIPSLVDGVRTVVIEADAQAVANGTAPLGRGSAAGMHLPASVLNAAAGIQRRNAKHLMADPAIFGVGVTGSYDNPAEAALLVLVDSHRTPRATPASVDGLRVRYVFLDRFHVTKSKYAGAPHPSSCALRAGSAHGWALRSDGLGLP